MGTACGASVESLLVPGVGSLLVPGVGFTGGGGFSSGGTFGPPSACWGWSPALPVDLIAPVSSSSYSGQSWLSSVSAFPGASANCGSSSSAPARMFSWALVITWKWILGDVFGNSCYNTGCSMTILL